MNFLLSRHTFTNADQEIVPYDGSPVSWRISVYVLVQRLNESNVKEILIIKNQLEKLHDVVGGGVELGETLEEAIQREALEEAGADVKLGELLRVKEDWFYHRKGGFYHTLQLFYTAELVGELTNPSDSDIIWRDFVPVSEIGTTYHLPPIAEEVISKIEP
jgi:ADP-ribose pyrophosphatase YjhB (NUDIX family)